MSTQPATAPPAAPGAGPAPGQADYEDRGPGHAAGNLTKAPELRMTNDGRPVTTLRLADTPREWDKQAGVWVDLPTVYTDVQCWGRTAENVVECLLKGDRVAAVGRWQCRSWHDAQGARQERVTLVARDIGPSLLFRMANPDRSSATRRPG